MCYNMNSSVKEEPDVRRSTNTYTKSKREDIDKQGNTFSESFMVTSLAR